MGEATPAAGAVHEKRRLLRRPPAWVAPSLVGLLGVVLGTFLSVWTTDRADSRQRASDFRVARRLVMDEVSSNRFFVTETSLGNLPFVTADAWESQASVLARGLSDAQWNAVSSYYESVTQLRRFLATKPDLRDQGPWTRERLRVHGFGDELRLAIKDDTASALAALKQHSG